MYGRPTSEEDIREKRLPMVMVLDVTNSMLWRTREKNRLKTMNAMVNKVLRQCLDTQKIRLAMEVCFILFADKVVLQTPFRNIMELGPEMIDNAKYRDPSCGEVKWNPYTGTPYQIPEFTVSYPQYGTNIGAAVQQAVDILVQRFTKLKAIGSYPGFLMLITDGHPAEPNNPDYWDDLSAEQAAIRALRSHTTATRTKNDMIVPFIIGVGDMNEINEERLQGYTAHWPSGYYSFSDADDEKNWEFMIKIMQRSIRNSMHLGDLAHLDDLNY